MITCHTSFAFVLVARCSMQLYVDVASVVVDAVSVAPLDPLVSAAAPAADSLSSSTGPPGESGSLAVKISTPSSVTRRVCSEEAQSQHDD